MDQLLLFQIFLSRMPPHVQTALVSLSDDMCFHNKVEITDKITAATGHVASISVIQHRSSHMEKQLAAIQAQVSNLSIQLTHLAEGLKKKRFGGFWHHMDFMNTLRFTMNVHLSLRSSHAAGLRWISNHWLSLHMTHHESKNVVSAVYLAGKIRSIP